VTQLALGFEIRSLTPSRLNLTAWAALLAHSLNSARGSLGVVHHGQLPPLPPPASPTRGSSTVGRSRLGRRRPFAACLINWFIDGVIGRQPSG
jgi:hypothetical protein